MRGFRTFIRLSSRRKALVLRTVILVAVIRAALFLIPFRRIQVLVNSSRRLPFSVPRETPVAYLVWAVQAASKRIPAASCLTQSLALKFLMERSGRSSQIHIGVAKDTISGFRAHAWVEYEGVSLLSEVSEIERYGPSMIMESGRV